MKLTVKNAWVSLLCVVAFSANADELSAQYSQQTSSNTGDLVTDLQNLGAYLGFNIQNAPQVAPPDKGAQPSLIDATGTQLIQNYVLNTLFGAMPVNAMSAAVSQFLPTTQRGASVINALANATFNYQQYNTPSSNALGVSVSTLIDQQPYQPDPVTQSVLNILGTPDYTYCMQDASTMNNNCTYLYQNLVMNNVLGQIPNATDAFNPSCNQQIIGQLNSNTLISPLLYSTDTIPKASSSTTNTGMCKTFSPGLIANNQIQEAANFIRYASGSVSPSSLPQLQDYTNLWGQANPSQGTTTTPPTLMQQIQAQSTLTNYLTSLRVYAAQTSVGMSNLYYILSKRLPQNEGQDSKGNPMLSSEALSEFKMATWRLFNPDLSSNNQWINQINTATPPTVQKEIAVLLAEINYQMYQSRQLQERMLLTQSIQLLQNTKASQPSPNFQNAGAQ